MILWLLFCGAGPTVFLTFGLETFGWNTSTAVLHSGFLTLFSWFFNYTIKHYELSAVPLENWQRTLD